MQTKYNLNELYPDDPPRRETVRLEIVPGGTVKNNIGRLAGPPQGSTARVESRSRLSAAWLALRMMLMVLGGVVSIAYCAALPRILQFAAVGVAVLTWFLLYTMIRESFRVGKNKAGRLLDGREWNQYPGVEIK